MVALFWIFMYFLSGCVINAILSVWEARDILKSGEKYTGNCMTMKELYRIVLWPVAFIQYVKKSYKNIDNETPKYF